MSLLTDNEKRAAVEDFERHTTGTNDLYRHKLNKGMLYTDGVRFLAETCGAWWLVDAVASHHMTHNLPSFLVWQLHKTRSGSWVLVAWTDTPKEPGSRRIVMQRIPYSDFPEGMSGYRWYLEHGTMMLRAER